MMPESFEYANNGGRKYLYRNLGGGRFEEVSEKVGLKSHRWALAAVAADLRGTGYPGSVHRQRLRRLRAVRQRGRHVPRDRQGERRRLRPEERHERVGRRRAQPGRVRDLRVEHLRGRHPASRATTSGCRRGAHGRRRRLREPGARDGRRPRRLELRRAVRRPEQRRLPRPLPGQRLRLGVEDATATGTTTRRSPAATRW